MAQREQRTSSKPAMSNMAEFAKTGQKQVVDLQKKFFNLDEMTRDWTARVKAETDIANEFIEKLSAVRSVPEAVTTYQEWMNQRMKMFAEDSQRLFADGQKVMAATAQMLAGGWKRL